jgi:hypothetical protein
MISPVRRQKFANGEEMSKFRASRGAFSREVGPGSREENASKQRAGASVPIHSERRLQIQTDNCFSAIESHSACAWRTWRGARFI